MALYDLTPVDVPKVETKYRTIQTPIPVPESLPIFAELSQSEPRSMMGQPPVIWHRAHDCTVEDKWGNRWIDWSSCVLVANAGHGRDEINQALHAKIDQGLISTYVFVHEGRAKLTRLLRDLSPDPARYQTFLLSTGSEATENCIKLAKTYAREAHGPQKKYFVTFENAFHGRTMGAQLAGGMAKFKTWMGDTADSSFVQVPFPDGYKNEDTRFELFLESLAVQGIEPAVIAGVMSESYQGVGPDFMPVEYAQKLAAFCRQHDIVLIMDEVQAGFGRSGKMFTYQHYDIQPDLIACGKGISSSLPLSAVIGRTDIMDLYAPGSMTSTHSASPLCVEAALVNLKLIQDENLVEHAAAMGRILIPALQRIGQKYPAQLGCVHGQGLVAGIQVVKPGTKTADPEAAVAINLKALQMGLLMFAPVGIGGECLKIAPPLTISEEMLNESIEVFEAAVDSVFG